MRPPPELIEIVGERSESPWPPALAKLKDMLTTRYGEGLEAILFYGSCLRNNELGEGLVDLYAVVSSYRTAYAHWAPALFNKLLPPNVYYLETTWGEAPLRAKCAVVSFADLDAGTSSRTFHSYFWGRFAQPAVLVHARDAQAASAVKRVLAQAVMTFVIRVFPQLPSEFDAQELWEKGLSLSYRAELRTESPGRAAELVAHSRDYLERLTRAAAAPLPYAHVNQDHPPITYRTRISRAVRARSWLGWRIRSAQGKLLSVLRLMKALFTFQGGIDYIAWKLERHSGVPIEVPPKVRRHPLLFIWPLMWRLYRRGVFR